MYSDLPTSTFLLVKTTYFHPAVGSLEEPLSCMLQELDKATIDRLTIATHEYEYEYATRNLKFIF